MTSKFEFTESINSRNTTQFVGSSKCNDDLVARGKCPYCHDVVAFRQKSNRVKSEVNGYMVPLRCDGCSSLVITSIKDKNIIPAPSEEGLDDLPEDIDRYYSEGLRCIEANSPNGAAAVFRKTIESICTTYGVTDTDQNDDIYDMINKLAENGHITETHRKSLLALKDAGNDGAHLNDNDPTLEQVRNLREIIESVLTATIIAEQHLDTVRESHPNPHQE